MTPAERAKLARILGMLGSEHAGERASAALQAEAFRKRHGMTWEEMLARPPVEAVMESVWTPPPAPPPSAPPVTQWEFIDVRQPSKPISYNAGVAAFWFLLFAASLGSIDFLR
jgi:hypothetical protein